MEEKFKNIFRIGSARLQEWDYRWNAAYYITISTQGKECYFGKVNHGEMIRSENGIIANRYWLEIPKHFPFVKLDEYVVMPDHIHGIVWIDNPDNNINSDLYRVMNIGLVGNDCRDAINRVSTEKKSKMILESKPIEKRGGVTGEKNPIIVSEQNI